jgi:orotidine-5'-phosphate decarboxylase
MKFIDKYRSAAHINKSLLCVGLDQCDFEANKKIVELTHDLVCAYKPNSAFYEAEGARGIESLKKICEYLQSNYPEIPIILDAKRGDIGNTNEQYAKFAFEYLEVDAITLQPYQGLGALSAFEKYSEKFLIVLCKTSNPESSEYQGELWRKIASNVATKYKENGQWGVVFGATHPRELSEVRQIVGDMPILVPGVGAQGGKIEDVLTPANSHGVDMIINVSRSVINAVDPRAVAKEYRDKMLTKFLN